MNECAHLDKFFDSLQSKDVWMKIISDIRALREKHNVTAWLDERSPEEVPLMERMAFDLSAFSSGELEKVFAKHLLSLFEYPPITASELTEIALEQLSGAFTLEELRAATQRFWACVARDTFYCTEDVNTCDVDVDIGDFFWPMIEEDEFVIRSIAEKCEPIWRSEHGFWLTLTESGSSIQAMLVGQLSDRALQHASSVMRRLIASASVSLHLIYCDPQQGVSFGLVPFVVDLDAVAGDLASPQNGFFRSILDFYFYPPAKKTAPFEQRLRNAVHLLVEADDQSSHAVSLALSFGAIEALVCGNSSGIVDELSRHVAALIQPNALDRPDVIKSIKRLYDIRSKAMHGERLDGDDDSRWKARMLAAAVLKAATEWKEHVERMGKELERREFLDELREIAITGGPMVGVSTQLTRLLPTNK